MRRLLVLATAVALCAGPLIGAQAAGAAVVEQAAVTAQINGSGSSWAQVAIVQWITDVTARNLQVAYTGTGSAQGRTDFRNSTTDFAVSDIGFQGFDRSNDTNDTNCTDPNHRATCRPYVYLPMVAGGTSFPYQIRVGGQLVQNLRLSGKTLAEIFTNKITNWDDPAITRDNNGRKLPSLQITPVVHSEGSGSTAQFTSYLDAEFPSLWRPFAGGPGMTEYFPRQGRQIAENGSDGIINFVTSASGNGAIGYDEYAYALGQSCAGCVKGWPVAQLENSAGYFTAPTQYNVAVALTKAEINMNKSSAGYLLEKLNKVYTNPDKRTYPLSSYSYMIIPTSAHDARMSTAKRQTLADFIDWSICGGQAEMGPIGYSPLPINLAQASFQQMYKLHNADHHVQISQLNIATECHNPTFWAGHPSGNYLAQIAPEPPACAKAGNGPCVAGTGVGPTGNPGKNGKPPASTSGSTSPTASPSSSSSASASTPSGGTSAGTVAIGGSTGGSGTGLPLTGSPTNLAASEGNSMGGLLAALAGFEVLLLLALPPVIARRRQQGRAGK